MCSHKKAKAATRYDQVDLVKTTKWIDFQQKPQYLDAPIKPQILLIIQQNQKWNNVSIQLDTIGIDETRYALNRLRQGGSVNEFLSKYQDAKYQCIAKHMQDIIQFSQI